MDITLSLAHFCELHGPTSLLCTQALPIQCAHCYPNTSASPPVNSALAPLVSCQNRLALDMSRLGCSQNGNDICESCQMSLPDDILSRTRMDEEAKPALDMRFLRTIEELQACTDQCVSRGESGNTRFNSYLETDDPSVSHSSCHKHHLEYCSSPSPAISTTYSILRSATIRTLSGEQLPRGHKLGPICFGDSSTGYTIAYVFRLVDPLARGHHRFYALLALAGLDSLRAIEACAIIWASFEQIARNIVESAEYVAAQKASTLNSPGEAANITPISSFLAGPLTFDQDGFSRRGTAVVRPNGIANLLGNPDFFCELHITFVSVIREMGKLLGGLRITPIARHISNTGDQSGRDELLHYKEVESEENQTGVSPDTARKGAIISESTFVPDLRSRGVHCNSPLMAQADALAV